MAPKTLRAAEDDIEHLSPFIIGLSFGGTSMSTKPAPHHEPLREDCLHLLRQPCDDAHELERDAGEEIIRVETSNGSSLSLEQRGRFSKLLRDLRLGVKDLAEVGKLSLSGKEVGGEVQKREPQLLLVHQARWEY